MRRYISCLLYMIKHKWFVYVACLKLKNKSVELFWRAIVHDLSKFMPSEWFAYSKAFFAPDGSKQYIESTEFYYAWNAHQKRNKHHWQYYILNMDSGETKILPMPEIYVWEMVADWMGAGRAINGKWEVWEWYSKNKHKMILHIDTKCMVERILRETTIS